MNSRYTTRRKISINYGEIFGPSYSNIYDKNEYYYGEYCQAAHCISEIVSTSSLRGSKINSENDDSIDELLFGYPNNIVAFCGHRGFGKTSAMISISHALKELPIPKSIDNSKLENNEGDTDSVSAMIKNSFWRSNRLRKSLAIDENISLPENKSYFVLDPIDPTTMENDNSILNMILSRMYHVWEIEKGRKSREDISSNVEYRELERSFQIAQSQILALKRDFKIEPFDDYDNLTRLSESGDSIVAKRSFYKVVKKFLAVMGNKDYLVLQLDDADLNTEHVYDIMEDVRKYLVGPHIIILFAIHLKTLSSCIEQEKVKSFKYLLDTKYNISHMDKYRAREMTERYIDKLIPSNHRIILHSMDERFRNGFRDLDLFYNYNNENLLSEFCNDSLNNQFEHQLYQLIYNRTGLVLMPPKDFFHNILPKRMREVTHFLHEFYELDSVDPSGIGSYHNLMLAMMGRDIEKKEKAKELLEIRLHNLGIFQDYIISKWCPHNLDISQFRIIEELIEVPVEQKCKRTVELIQKYNSQIKKENSEDAHIQDDLQIPVNTDISYIQVIELLHRMKHLFVNIHKFEFIYAIHLCFSISFNRYVCQCIYDRKPFDLFTKRCRNGIFRGIEYGNSADYLVSKKIFDKFNIKFNANQAFLQAYYRPSNKKGDYYNYDLFQKKGNAWTIKDNVEWLISDVDSLLLYLVSETHTNRFWVSQEVTESENEVSEEALWGIGAALQIICNYDMQYRIQKFYKWPDSIDECIGSEIRTTLISNVQNLFKANYSNKSGRSSYDAAPVQFLKLETADESISFNAWMNDHNDHRFSKDLMDALEISNITNAKIKIRNTTTEIQKHLVPVTNAYERCEKNNNIKFSISVTDDLYTDIMNQLNEFETNQKLYSIFPCIAASVEEFKNLFTSLKTATENDLESFQVSMDSFKKLTDSLANTLSMLDRLDKVEDLDQQIDLLLSE